MNKILFLGIEGVLTRLGGPSALIPANVRRLRQLVDSTGCKVIMHDDRRLYPLQREHIAEELANYGVLLSGYTPEKRRVPTHSAVLHTQLEILAFCLDHTLNPAVDALCVLHKDAAKDGGVLAQQWVCPALTGGLGDQDVMEAEIVLNRLDAQELKLISRREAALLK